MSFYWYDYETTGIDTRLDRPLQFAGLRTDDNLEPIGEPDMFRMRLPEDVLPHPQAVLVTGVLPAGDDALPEAVFADRVAAHFSVPGTCTVGFNSMRFDAEVTRHLFWRNLVDPYAHEWRDGNSRWDLLDALRCARLLRPEGLEWPEDDQGTPSFRLEALTAANGIEHGAAHDALADVQATLSLARRLRDAQPKLFAYLLTLRSKQVVRDLLAKQAPLLHVSGRFPAAQGAASLILPLPVHPVNNQVACWDLRHDPEPLMEHTPEDLARWLVTSAEDLPETALRPAIKNVYLNRAPVLVAASALREEGVAECMALDPDRALRHLAWIRDHHAAFVARVEQIVEAMPAMPQAAEPEAALYEGFVDDRDRAHLAAIRRATVRVLQDPAALVDIPSVSFADPRLGPLVERYLARNLPQVAGAETMSDYRNHCRARLGLTDSPANVPGVLDFQGFEEALASAHQTAGPEGQALLDALADWGRKRKEALQS
ncbi:MAG: exodeoxyribonuclease I [Halothiobacillaceae bacterium]